MNLRFVIVFEVKKLSYFVCERFAIRETLKKVFNFCYKKTSLGVIRLVIFCVGGYYTKFLFNF